MPPVPHSMYILEFYLCWMNECDAELRKVIREKKKVMGRLVKTDPT